MAIFGKGSLLDKDKLAGALSGVKDSVTKVAKDTTQSLKDSKAEMDADNAPVEGAIKKYEVLYIGGLPQYEKRKSEAIGFNILSDRFYFKKGYTSKKWFEDMEILYSAVKKIEIVERTISNAEFLLSSSGSDMKAMEQKNNIEITYDTENGIELVLRLEMLTGTSIYGQAGKCREMMDVLRQNGILKMFKGEETQGGTSQGDDVLSQIEKLSKLKESGILTEEEFEKKKTELLAKL